jgi:hypothetical protein
MEFAAEELSEHPRAGGQAANSWMMAKYDQLNPPAMKKLLAGGTKLHAFSPPIMQACLKATKELYAETSATNPNFKKVLESMNRFTTNGYQWFQVAETRLRQLHGAQSAELIVSGHFDKGKPRSEIFGVLRFRDVIVREGGRSSTPCTLGQSPTSRDYCMPRFRGA